MFSDRKIALSFIGVILLFIIGVGGTFAYFYPKTKTTQQKVICRESKSVESAKPAVTRVVSKVKDQYTVGSGFFDSNGNIITNSHVVDLENSEVSIFLNDGKMLKAKLLANDIYRDIAILKPEESYNGNKLSWGSTEELKEPDTLIALGYALDLPGAVSITKGSFSAKRSYKDVDYVQTDTAINQGNSGGPLIDACGNVVGINTLISTNSTVNLAISAESAKKIIEEMAGSPKVTYFTGGVRQTIISELLQLAGMPDLTGEQDLSSAVKNIENTNSKKAAQTNSADKGKSKSTGTTGTSSTGQQNTNTKTCGIKVNPGVNAAQRCGLSSGNEACPDGKILPNKSYYLLATFPGFSVPTVTWDGPGKFVSVGTSTLTWQATATGEQTITATIKEGNDECKATHKVNVFVPTSVPGLARIMLLNLFSPTSHPTTGEDSIEIGLGYVNSNSVDITPLHVEVEAMPISADIVITDSASGFQIHSKHYENNEIRSDYYRKIFIPVTQLNFPSGDYAANRNNYWHIDATVHTPEQGSFTAKNY